MNWPGVCNINSSLNVRASFFCFLLHFLFAFAVSRNAPFDPSHRFVFFLPCEAPRRLTCTFFFHRHCFADLCSGNWLGVCGLGEPRQSLEPAEAWPGGLHSWLQLPSPPSFCSPRLLDTTRLNDRGDHLLFPPCPSLKKKTKPKRGLVEYWCNDGYAWQSYRV